MKKQLLSTICICFLALGINSCASKKNSTLLNMVARMEVKEPIKDLCDQNNVYVILPMSGNGQVKAIAPKSNAEITKELNAKVDFLKDKPDYEDKGSVNLIVNCKGKLVQCKISNKTKSPELDSQIEAVFAELTNWTPGSMHQKPVDTANLTSFTIKDGKISMER